MILYIDFEGILLQVVLANNTSNCTPFIQKSNLIYEITIKIRLIFVILYIF